jgi:hypothetical protein
VHPAQQDGGAHIRPVGGEVALEKGPGLAEPSGLEQSFGAQVDRVGVLVRREDDGCEQEPRYPMRRSRVFASSGENP